MNVFFTDLEPDDLIALYILPDKFKKGSIFIVGEGNSVIKFKRMEYYVKLFGFTDTIIIQGLSSKNIFPYDGKEIGINDKSLQFISDNSRNYENILKNIKDNSNFYIMKPPRELMIMFMENPKIFSNCNAFISGSFNLRSLIGGSIDRKSNEMNLINMINSFKSCKIYENHHAIGSKNNISYDEIQLIDLKSDNYDPLNFAGKSLIPKEILMAMYYWDRYNLDDCIETMDKIMTEGINKSNEDQYNRNKKCAEQIKFGLQFVASDVFFIMTLDDNSVPCSISFDSGYLVPIVKISSSISIIMPDNKELYRENLIKLLKEKMK